MALPRPIPSSEIYSTVALQDGKTLNLELDIYAPPRSLSSAPAVIFFHGGALTSYNKTQLPDWLLDATLKRHAYFISVNYRLLCPFSVHDMVQDIHALFRHLETKPYLDLQNLVAAGSSAGGLLASLSVMHAPIRLKGHLSLMGLGGKHFHPEHFVNSNRSFFFDCESFDTELLTEENLSEYFATFRPPACWQQQPVQEASVDALWQGKPTNLYQQRHPRSFLMRVWQSVHNAEAGTSEFLDVMLGRHVKLSELTDRDKRVFPMLASKEVLERWPPALFIHGSSDQIVLPEDSEALKDLIASHHQDHPRHAQLEIVQGGGHEADAPAQNWNKAIQKTREWLDEVWGIREDEAGWWHGTLRMFVKGFRS